MHTHKGIYLICVNDSGHLLTIEKNGGPYINRLDLPGGTPENEESELETVVREVYEETGYQVQSANKLGERIYEIPWRYKKWTLSQHTAVYFIGKVDEANQLALASIPDQDSKGTLWIDPTKVQEEWCSPLVWEAIQYLKNYPFPMNMKCYESWDVLGAPEYLYQNVT
ncbi:NUDIX domain-containing protein [Bacillus sp. NEB1478]|uniref:NUDIX domain-containing protein n=1 Tax=Bacillus sp. NEB1478 TaxID=3073816 RepID=UPI002873C1C5|nr:NUDIX domain-containing protein [Bacillus sp. NEB1478]WNB90713.1 NUDIX domain-containing protein [Bacillus sp. NEB1478]